MLDKKSLRKALILSTTLMVGSLMIPANAFAISCSSNISGTDFSGVICDFDTGNNITISSEGEVGGINQVSYNPSSSFITNNGTINSERIGINVSDSSLSSGITNNGSVVAADEAGILVTNSSTISGNISNTGSITSTNYMALQLDDNSTLNGNIINNGSIISNSVNNPAMLIRESRVIGSVNNSGTIRAYGIGNGFLLHSFGGGNTIEGNITNSGSIRGGGSGLFLNLTRINGSIENSGNITSDSEDGVGIINGSYVQNGIVNSGNIRGYNHGIKLEGFNYIFTGLTNQAGATITGVNGSGLYLNDNSPIFANIKNYGTITGSTYGIYINIDSTSGDIDTYEGSTVNGAIDAVATTLNIYGGTINGTINVSAVNIRPDAVFTMTHAITVDNAVTNAGELLIGSATRTINGDYTQSSSGVLKIDMQGAATYGKLAVTGTANLSASGAIDVDIASGVNIVVGDELSGVITAATVTAPSPGFTVTDNSRLVNFVGAVSGGSAVDLTAVDDASTSMSGSSSVGGNSSSAGAAAKLDEIALNANGDWNNIIGTLNRMTSDHEIANAVNQTTPALSGASNVAIVETMNTAMHIVQARQDLNAGLSSGEDFKTNQNLWIKTFGSWGEQGNKDGVVGYNSNAYGFIAGADKAINDEADLGVGVSYYNSKLTSNNDRNHVNVDSFLGIGYGSYKLDGEVEINAQVALGYNRSDSKRYINFGAVNRVAKASYDGWSLHAGSGISRLVKVSDDTTIAPQFRVDYFNVGTQGYSESGAGVLDLNVGSQTQAQLIPALEVKADHKFASRLSLALNAGLGYDIFHDANTVNASFAGGGGEFITRGLKPSPWIVRSGAGLTWKQSDELDFTAFYDRRDRGSYDNQTVSLKARLMF